MRAHDAIPTPPCARPLNCPDPKPTPHHQSDAERLESEAKALSGPDGLKPDASGSDLQKVCAAAALGLGCAVFGGTRLWGACSRGRRVESTVGVQSQQHVAQTATHSHRLPPPTAAPIPRCWRASPRRPRRASWRTTSSSPSGCSGGGAWGYRGGGSGVGGSGGLGGVGWVGWGWLEGGVQ
jgi:hypothetical protein